MHLIYITFFLWNAGVSLTLQSPAFRFMACPPLSVIWLKLLYSAGYYFLIWLRQRNKI